MTDSTSSYIRGVMFDDELYYSAKDIANYLADRISDLHQLDRDEGVVPPEMYVLLDSMRRSFIKHMNAELEKNLEQDVVEPEPEPVADTEVLRPLGETMALVVNDLVSLGYPAPVFIGPDCRARWTIDRHRDVHLVWKVEQDPATFNVYVMNCCWSSNEHVVKTFLTRDEVLVRMQEILAMYGVTAKVD